MVSMDLQAVMKDKYSLAVIEGLSKGDASSELIAKRNHLPPVGVDKAVNHLLAEGIIGGPSNSLYLTDKGMDLMKRIREMELTPSGTGGAPPTSRRPDRLGPEDQRRRKENQGG